MTIIVRLFIFVAHICEAFRPVLVSCITVAHCSLKVKKITGWASVSATHTPAQRPHTFAPRMRTV